MKNMRILITNNTLSNRAGTELYVRDIVLALRERNHHPIAYSNILGEVAEEILQEGIPVVDDLNKLSWKPDIIHCQHHLETMTAIVHFPDVPAVYFCHGWRPWQEIPPLHPRILKYIAVNEPTLNFAVQNHGIPPDLIHIIPNFVDLNRFKQRGPLPARPLRALLFSNYAAEKTHIPAVRKACLSKGITLDIAGLYSGNPLKKPEEVIGAYDLVFAIGRAALESLAVGAAVILCDALGVGPMVTSNDLDRLRKLNFGVNTFHSPLNSDAIIREIERYNASDAAAVTLHIRSLAGLDKALDSIIALYEEVIGKFSLIKTTIEAEAKASANYLRWMSSLMKEKEFTWTQQHNTLNNTLNTLTAEFNASLAIRIKNYLIKVPILGHILRRFSFYVKAWLRDRNQ